MQTRPLITAPSLSALLQDQPHRDELARVLTGFIEDQRWFAAKTDGIRTLNILDSVSIPDVETEYELVLAAITTNGGATDCYALPVAIATGDQVGADADMNGPTIARLTATHRTAASGNTLLECSGLPEFWKALTTSLADASLTTRNGRQLKLSRTSRSQVKDAASLRRSHFTVHDGEQSNTAVSIGDDFFLKLFRRPRVGHNPDAEVGTFLTDKTSFANSPRVDATIDLLGNDGERCLALISEQVTAEIDAWAFTLNSLKDYWRRLAAIEDRPASPPRMTSFDASTIREHVSLTEGLIKDLMGSFHADVVQLGRRTAELHTALSSRNDAPAFAPELLSQDSLRELVGQIRLEVSSTCQLLEQADQSVRSIANLPRKISERANTLLDAMSAFDAVQANVVAIRCHGDYHLGQVLRTDNDFVILDFEGEPDRPFDERRQKRCAMKDVAGMIRSLHYASCAAAIGMLPGPAPEISTPDMWQTFWFESAATGFLVGYEQQAAGQVFFPKDRAAFQQLLNLFLIEKVLYELRYEINNRPDWVAIPLLGLTSVLGITP